MSFEQGFTIWRALGHQADGALLDFNALVAIHFVHRLFAVVVAMLALWLVVRLWQQGPALKNWARWLLVLMGLQVLTGVSNVVFDWPLLAAVLHTGGAAALVIVLTQLLANTRAHWQGQATPLQTESNWTQEVDTRPSLPGEDLRAQI